TAPETTPERARVAREPRPDVERTIERPEPRASARSTLARRLDRELSELERRLFPDAAPAPAAASIDDVREREEALSDIDLDAVGIDTLPGIALDSLALKAPEGGPVHANGSVDALAGGTGAFPLGRLAVPTGFTPPPAPPAPLAEEGSLAKHDLAGLLC